MSQTDEGTSLDDGRITFGVARARTNVVERDPVCGVEVHPEAAAGPTRQGDKLYYFCSESCRQTFGEDPGRYVSADVR